MFNVYRLMSLDIGMYPGNHLCHKHVRVVGMLEVARGQQGHAGRWRLSQWELL